MATPIDFGKEFLHILYRERDVDRAVTYLADDIVWVTPEEIHHLKNPEDIRGFIVREIADDPQPFNVDIASIKSAPVSGDTNTIVYEVNLIPKREQDTVNLRCAFTIHQKADGGLEIVYLGMSRRYVRSGEEQIRGFMENLPGGFLVIAGFGDGVFRELYANDFLAGDLGYSTDEFFDESDVDPFFMMPDVDHKRILQMIREMARLTDPKPVTMKTALKRIDGSKVPYQVVIRAAYKDRNGGRTILYLLFTGLSDTLREVEKQHKKEMDELTGRKLVDVNAEVERLASEAIEEKEKAAKSQEDADQRMEDANRRIDEAGELIKKAQEAADQAAEDARKGIEEARKNAKDEAAKNLEALKTDYEAKLSASKDEIESLTSAMRQAESDYQQRIIKLEHDLTKLQDENSSALEAQKTTLTEESEQKIEDLKARAKNNEDALYQRIEQANAEKSQQKADYEKKIEHLKAEIADREAGIESAARQSLAGTREKDKTMERLSWLIKGEMNAVHSLTDATLKEKDPAKQQQILKKIMRICDEVPPIADDLKVVAGLGAGDRAPETGTFLLSECILLVRKIVRPQCRQKGIIFSCETNGTVPDKVVGSKAGLQLAFLTILENAVHSTAQGGKIILTAEADPPVRGAAYFHFVISDTGCGIADAKLPVLFDNPTGELSIARRVISAMGGSIQVRSEVGSGSKFEISVSMRLG